MAVKITNFYLPNSGETLKLYKINFEKEEKEHDFDEDETNLRIFFVSISELLIHGEKIKSIKNF